LAEEFGDVVFVAARGVVFVHRARAEHIARELGGMRQQPVPALPARQVSPAVRHVRPSTVPDAVAVVAMPLPRWRAACAWLGMALGAAVFIAALAVPLDDPALVVALMLTLRSGRVVGTA
jgi:hypothetical protein